jgi:hypothetical protein
MEIHPSARKHGIVDADIEHAMENAMALKHQDDGRLLYLGPCRSGAVILEVVKVIGLERVIHAMKDTQFDSRWHKDSTSWRKSSGTVFSSHTPRSNSLMVATTKR